MVAQSFHPYRYVVTSPSKHTKGERGKQTCQLGSGGCTHALINQWQYLKKQQGCGGEKHLYFSLTLHLLPGDNVVTLYWGWMNNMAVFAVVWKKSNKQKKSRLVGLKNSRKHFFFWKVIFIWYTNICSKKTSTQPQFSKALTTSYQ